MAKLLEASLHNFGHVLLNEVFCLCGALETTHLFSNKQRIKNPGSLLTYFSDGGI